MINTKLNIIMIDHIKLLSGVIELFFINSHYIITIRYLMTKGPGFVYILTNPSFKEDWVKIGKSARPVNVRSKELDNTAVPLPFEIYATLKTVKYSEVERLVHKTIDRLTDLRIRSSREFFNITPAEALNILRDISETLDDAEIQEYVTDTSMLETRPDNSQPRHQRRKQFWTEFIQYCKDNDGLYAGNSPVGDNWIGKSLRVSNGVNINAVIGYDFARQEIYINSGSKELNKKLFDYTYANKNDLQSQVSAPLVWERLDDKVTCRIKVEMPVHTFDVEDRTPIFAFLAKYADEMFTAFHNCLIDFKA